MGLSTTADVTDPGDFSVSYQNISIFDNVDDVSDVAGVVNLTRAYTNPMNGIQSIGFLNHVTVLDEATGELKRGLWRVCIPLQGSTTCIKHYQSSFNEDM
ncbi:MAG: hypothetical protein J6Z46_02140 [Lachnospiraceae bacterium]|nr:hypothetical protein [Lachnospiraceae bacterium]